MAQITLNSTGVASSGSLVLQSNGTTAAVTIDTSQRAAFVAGTAALPAITTTGDTNTGIFFPAADTIAFSEGGVEAMRIDSSGRLGVGTSTPVTYLQVGNGSGSSSNYIWAAGNSTNPPASATYGVLLGSNLSQGSSEANIVWGQGVASGQYLGIGKWTGSAYTEQMRIDSSGNLLVGATTYFGAGLSLGSPASSGCASIWAAGGSGNHFRFGNVTNGIVGGISTTTSATTYSTSSDYRLKNTIAPMTGALEKVALLKPCTYKWNTDGSDGEGFIAHELQAVVPECVTGEKDAVDADGNPQYQGIDTSFLVATLTAAIQELKAIVDAQASTITQLQADVAALKGASA
jgi:hypothetical protein